MPARIPQPLSFSLPGSYSCRMPSLETRASWLALPAPTHRFPADRDLGLRSSHLMPLQRHAAGPLVALSRFQARCSPSVSPWLSAPWCRHLCQTLWRTPSENDTRGGGCPLSDHVTEEAQQIRHSNGRTNLRGTGESQPDSADPYWLRQ